LRLETSLLVAAYVETPKTLMLSLYGPQRQALCDGISRRDFLRIGSLAMGGLSLPQLLNAEAQNGTKRGSPPGYVGSEDGCAV
jgi:hypothetical protein